MFHSRVHCGNVSRMKVIGIGIAAACALLVLGGAAHQFDVGMPDDAVPRGMVAYFTGAACPSGWNPADVATGRIEVAVTDPLAVGRTVGTPLGPAEDRVHHHPIAATMSLPAKSISAADGNNNQGAASGDRTVGGTAGDAPSGLPFVQLTACVRP
jgi:hypothetical protein